MLRLCHVRSLISAVALFLLGFAASCGSNAGVLPPSLAAADLDGDGKLDIVTVNAILNGSGSGSSSVLVLLQDSANPGRFLAAANYPTGSLRLKRD